MTSRLANLKTMAGVNVAVCILLTLGTLPLLMTHTWESVSGPARLSLLGFVLFDLAIWTSSHLATRGHSALVRAVALGSKVTLAILAILAASSVLALRGDRLIEEHNRETHLTQERARLSELANLTERLAASSGRSVAREFLQTAPPVTSAPSMTTASGSWLKLFPEWWAGLGIVACPTLAGLGVLSLLGALVGLGGNGQGEHREVSAPLPERQADLHTPTPHFLNFRRQETVPTTEPTPPAGGHTDARQDGPSVRYERKPNGRIEAWLSDASTTRGKRYLTSYSGNLSEAEQAARVRAALQRKVVAA